MGRRTYDWLIKQDLETFPYQDKDCYLLSSQPVELEKSVRLASSARLLLANLKENSKQDIWIVGGGLLISKLIQEGLLDCLQVMIAPFLLGDGVPLKYRLCIMERVERYFTHTYVYPYVNTNLIEHS